MASPQKTSFPLKTVPSLLMFIRAPKITAGIKSVKKSCYTLKVGTHTITFSDSANKEQFNVVIFSVIKDEISLAGFKSYLSMGSVCDTRWIDSVSGEPTLLNKNGIPILEVQVISGGPREGSNTGCYYFKNSGGNLVVFNISGFE